MLKELLIQLFVVFILLQRSQSIFLPEYLSPEEEITHLEEHLSELTISHVSTWSTSGKNHGLQVTDGHFEAWVLKFEWQTRPPGSLIINVYEREYYSFKLFETRYRDSPYLELWYNVSHGISGDFPLIAWFRDKMLLEQLNVKDFSFFQLNLEQNQSSQSSQPSQSIKILNDRMDEIILQTNGREHTFARFNKIDDDCIQSCNLLLFE